MGWRPHRRRTAFFTVRKAGSLGGKRGVQSRTSWSKLELRRTTGRFDRAGEDDPSRLHRGIVPRNVSALASTPAASSVTPPGPGEALA